MFLSTADFSLCICLFLERVRKEREQREREKRDRKEREKSEREKREKEKRDTEKNIIKNLSKTQPLHQQIAIIVQLIGPTFGNSKENKMPCEMCVYVCLCVFVCVC